MSSEEQLVSTELNYDTATDDVANIPLRFPHQFRWLAALGIALCALGFFVVGIVWLFDWGVGIWGINIPVAWAFAIINFVFWIEIAHAGTLISAILLLARARFRNSVNRFAEAMTIFAVTNAGIFPLLHLGRVQRFYWMFFYPNTMDMWPQWRSPLIFDVNAVGTYALVSIMFWYTGLIPDLATMRDSAKNIWAKRLYGVLAVGWSGSARHWERYETFYLIAAGFTTPLVITVLSIVSNDFATAIIPGWHATAFPPDFLYGAIYSGMAMALTIAIPLRSAFHLQEIVTERHLNIMGKILLVAGLFVGYGYATDIFTAFYSGDPYEKLLVVARATGVYAWEFWVMIFCNIVVGQTLWFRRVRTNPWLLFSLCLVINVGMWLDRFRIVVMPLHEAFMPGMWAYYAPTFWDWALTIGAFGLFATLMLLFIRFLPMSSMLDIRVLLGEVRGTDAENPEPRGRPQRPSAVDVGERPPGPLYGWMAQFDSMASFVAAARQAKRTGYEKPQAYSPFPVAAVQQALGMRRSYGVQLFMFGGYLTAFCLIFFMQFYAARINYPWNIGGRPLDSWPSFLIIGWVLGILTAVASGLAGMLILNRLPRPYQAVFNVPMFERASRDRFYLVLHRFDPHFDADRALGDLKRMLPLRIRAVPD